MRCLTIICLLTFCLSLNACRLAEVLSTQYSENIAQANYGTEANHPGLNDGNLETIATIPATNKRYFVIRFAEVKPVRKIIVHNVNLFRFKMEYLKPKTDEWETFHSVVQRRNLEGKDAQGMYLFDRLTFNTQMIRITVTRTVDDIVINKLEPDPGDRIVNQRQSMLDQYYPHYRVLRPSIAQVREIEVYHLVKNK